MAEPSKFYRLPPIKNETNDGHPHDDPVGIIRHYRRNSRHHEEKCGEPHTCQSPFPYPLPHQLWKVWTKTVEKRAYDRSRRYGIKRPAKMKMKRVKTLPVNI